MSEDPPEPTPAPAPADPPADDLRSQIADVLGSLLSGGQAQVKDTGRTATAPEPVRDDLEERVRRAVDDVHAQREHKSTMDTLKAEVASLKAAAEVAPEKVRPVERFMGWR